MHRIDYREYVDMEESAFIGKDNEAILRMLDPNSVDHINRMYFFDRLEALAERFLARLENK